MTRTPGSTAISEPIRIVRRGATAAFRHGAHSHAAVRAVMPMSECSSETREEMWTHDGNLGYWFHTDQFSIVAYWYGPAIFDVMVDVEVTYSGERWSAKFMTPEQIRECLTRWSGPARRCPATTSKCPTV